MSNTSIDTARLLGRLAKLGAIGRDADGRLVGLAASDTDKLGRDHLVAWIEQGGISHNPREFTADDDLVAGANILLDVVSKLAQEE